MGKVLDELFAIFDENPNNNHDFYDGLSLDEAIKLAIVINDSGIFYKKNGKLLRLEELTVNCCVSQIRSHFF